MARHMARAIEVQVCCCPRCTQLNHELLARLARPQLKFLDLLEHPFSWNYEHVVCFDKIFYDFTMHNNLFCRFFNDNCDTVCPLTCQHYGDDLPRLQSVLVGSRRSSVFCYIGRTVFLYLPFTCSVGFALLSLRGVLYISIRNILKTSALVQNSMLLALSFPFKKRSLILLIFEKFVILI